MVLAEVVANLFLKDAIKASLFFYKKQPPAPSSFEKKDTEGKDTLPASFRR